VETRASLRLELSVFLLGFGVILAAGAYLILRNLGDDPPPLWGYPRDEIGRQITVLSALHLGSGLLLLIFRGPLLGFVGAMASTAFAAYYFTHLFSALHQFILVSLLAAAVPVLVWHRAIKFLNAK